LGFVPVSRDLLTIVSRTRYVLSYDYRVIASRAKPEAPRSRMHARLVVYVKTQTIYHKIP